MKNRKLKKSIENGLIMLQLTLIIFLGAEITDTRLYILSKIIILLVILLNHYIIVKYGRLYEG